MIREFHSAVRMAQDLATAAIRTARLIDFGELRLDRLKCSEDHDSIVPFDGEPTGYTFIMPVGGLCGGRRFLCVVNPRACTWCTFEVIHTACGPCSRWLLSSIGGRVFSESPGSAEALSAAAWRLELADLMRVAKIESIPAPSDKNRKRRVRGLPPLPGYFRASLPPPSETSTFAARNGHHASPQPHLRRGHDRRLSNGHVVRVRPCSVRGGPPGVGAHLHSNRGGR